MYKTIDFTKPEKKKEPEPKKVQTNGSRNEDTTMPKALAKMMKRAYKACIEESDEVLVAKFVSEIKAIKSDFKPNTFGYSKFKDLCAAYPSEIELYENSNNALCIRLIDSAVEERGNSQSGNIKDIESLNEEQQNVQVADSSDLSDTANSSENQAVGSGIVETDPPADPAAPAEEPADADLFIPDTSEEGS